MQALSRVGHSVTACASFIEKLSKAQVWPAPNNLIFNCKLCFPKTDSNLQSNGFGLRQNPSSMLNAKQNILEPCLCGFGLMGILPESTQMVLKQTIVECVYYGFKNWFFVYSAQHNLLNHCWVVAFLNPPYFFKGCSRQLSRREFARSKTLVLCHVLTRTKIFCFRRDILVENIYNSM